MRLDASFGAAHRLRSLCHISVPPRCAGETLAVAATEAHARPPRVRRRRACAVGLHPAHRGSVRNLLQRVFSFLVILRAMEKFSQTVPHPRPAVPITNTTLQNTVKERPPLTFSPVTIFLHELQHRILHEIERLVVIPRGNLCHTERPPLNACQEPI